MKRHFISPSFCNYISMCKCNGFMFLVIFLLYVQLLTEFILLCSLFFVYVYFFVFVYKFWYPSSFSDRKFSFKYLWKCVYILIFYIRMIHGWVQFVTFLTSWTSNVKKHGHINCGNLQIFLSLCSLKSVHWRWLHCA